MELRKPKTSSKQYVTSQPSLTVSATANAPKTGVLTGGNPPVSRGPVPASAAKKGKSKRSKKY